MENEVQLMIMTINSSSQADDNDHTKGDNHIGDRVRETMLIQNSALGPWRSQ